MALVPGAGPPLLVAPQRLDPSPRANPAPLPRAQILFSWGASVYAGLRAKVDGFVAEKEVLTSVVAGFAFLIGLFLAYRRMKNKAYKMTLANALQTEPGFSYVKTVLGQLPAYLSMRGETDTVEWLNLLVADLFPSLSGMLAQIMSYAVEPVLEYYKPPGIKSMTFQRFTLGTQPMRFTGAKAGKFTRNAKDHVYVDLDFAFDSDAEIQVGALGACTCGEGVSKGCMADV